MRKVYFSLSWFHDIRFDSNKTLSCGNRRWFNLHTRYASDKRHSTPPQKTTTPSLDEKVNTYLGSGRRKADLMSRERESGYWSTQTVNSEEKKIENLYQHRKNLFSIIIERGKSLRKKKSTITFHSHLYVVELGGAEWDEKWMRFRSMRNRIFFPMDYELSESESRGGKIFQFSIFPHITQIWQFSATKEGNKKKSSDCEYGEKFFADVLKIFSISYIYLNSVEFSRKQRKMWKNIWICLGYTKMYLNWNSKEKERNLS